MTLRIGRFICLLAPYFVLAFCLVFTVGTRTLAPEERLETIIQLFYKAVREGKYEIAQQYLSREIQRHTSGRANNWAAIADELTKKGTLQIVEVGKVTTRDVGKAVVIHSVGTGFADGSSEKLRIALAKKGDVWKIFWFGKVREEQGFEDYVVSFVYAISPLSQYGHYFEILQAGNRVYMSEFAVGLGSFSLSHSEYDQKEHTSTEKLVIPMGKDITGDGNPNLVVFELTISGTHCCSVYHIFEIGREFRKIAELMGGDGNLDFTDLDGDSKLEVVLNDWAFAYFLTSFASYDPPKVILRYQGGAYRIAIDLMRKPAPSPEELERRAKQARKDTSWKGKYLAGPRAVPESLYAPMLELIYTGHPDLAWQFFDTAWPPKIKGKDSFLRKFRTRLEGSPFWPFDGKLRIPFRNRAIYVDKALRQFHPPIRERW